MHHQYIKFIYDILGVKVYLYGVFIALGILICLGVFFGYSKKAGMPDKIRDFCFFVAILAIVLGFGAAKLYQAFYDWIDTGKFNLSSAGITAMGGFIGGAVVFLIAYFGIGHFIYKGKEKGLHVKHFNTMFRVAPCCITIAHAFGRIGCLMSGCCHGKFLGTESVAGGIYMYGQDTGIYGYYVPTQLYEALFLFALFALLTVLFFKRSNITMPVYLIAYGVWRIIIEFFRDDARGGFVLGLAPSQWQSIIFIAGGIILLVVYALKNMPFVLPNDSKKVGETNEESKSE